MKEMLFTMMPMFVCLFWTVMLALELHHDSRKRPRLHLFVFMLTATILYFGHWVFFNHETTILPLTDTLYCMANLLVYPLYYLYICSLTTRKGHRKLRWLLLLPALVCGSLVGVVYLMMSEAETAQFVRVYLYEGEREGLRGLAIRQAVIHDLCKGFFGLLIIPVFAYGRHHLMQFRKLVNSLYADVEGKTLADVHQLLVVFVATAAMSFVFNIVGRHHVDNSFWLLAPSAMLFSVLLFAIGYIGYRQKFSIENVEQDEQQADAAGEENAAISELRHRIEQLMVDEQLFRQPNLKIVDIVQRLATNRNYVYIAINRDMGVSFSEYVNRMRIDYAAQLIQSYPDKPLTEIAEQSGFSSSTSFYRNFKQYKGVGPREYQNKPLT